ncbi:MAG: SUMF1/EgtB/PvdO family nonheme iron enzyme [Anaerolineales bacterium]|nr:SUMF1/EgtB/PvdO family nonheme iron enzyme [Anaerolineales bacterium]
MTRLLRVFLCHASQDKPIVRELYQRLKAENWIDPWLDKAKILPGQDWELVIEKAVDDSDVVIVCLSSQSVSKEGFVQREIRYAYDLALEKPEDTIFLIPLRLDDCAMPRKLRSFHWVDYFGKEKKNSYSDLLQALKLRYDQKLKMEEAQTQVEPKVEAPEKRFTQRKPYTKILDPSSLNPSSIRKNRSQPDYRRYGIAGIILLLIILGGLGLNSLFNKKPEVTPLPTLENIIETPKSPTKTLIPFTSTLTNAPSPSPTPTLGIGSTMISEKDGMVMVYVPAGEFTMGSTDYSDASPIHSIFLDAYFIDQTEVTNAAYRKCVDLGGCNPPKQFSSYSRIDYYENPKYDNYPVIYVDWNMAKNYCEWRDTRLPIEAEWEKAARGESQRTYPWGEGRDCNRVNYTYIDAKTYFARNCYGDTIQVGRLVNGVSPYGAYDLAGNVMEWVSSLYYPYPYIEDDGRENLTTIGPRVLRGGAWTYPESDVRSANRSRGDPTSANYNLGFRCAMDAVP